MKAFEYCRKSTKDKEDQQVLSLSGQREENRKITAKAGHEIVDSFDEEASAKRPGRIKFSDMLRRIEAGEAEAIVCWKLNRLARNPIDGGKIQWLLQQGIIKAIITSEKTYVPSDNVIQMSVEFGMATQFSLDLSKDVKRGMLQKAKMGWKPGTAPLGYMSDYGGVKGEKKIMKDPERWDIVRRCWEYLLTGCYTVPQIHELAVKEWRLTVRKGRKSAPATPGISTLYDIFNSPFYYGLFEWDGQIWKGAHEPMITREQFDRAQEFLGSRGKPRKDSHDNPYMGAIRCGECGGAIVQEVKTKLLKSKDHLKQFFYYRCSRQIRSCPCSQRGAVTRKDLQDEMMKIIEAIELPQAFIDWALQKLKLSQEDMRKEREKELERLQQEQKRAEQKIDDLIEMRLESADLFTDESFKRKMLLLEEERRMAERRIKEHSEQVKNWRDEVISDLTLIESIREKFLSDDKKERLYILHRVAESLELRDKQLNFRLRKTFTALRHGKEETRRILGSLEPVNCRYQSVESDVLAKVIPVWSR